VLDSGAKILELSSVGDSLVGDDPLLVPAVVAVPEMDSLTIGISAS